MDEPQSIIRLDNDQRKILQNHLDVVQDIAPPVANMNGDIDAESALFRRICNRFPNFVLIGGASLAERIAAFMSLITELMSGKNPTYYSNGYGYHYATQLLFERLVCVFNQENQKSLAIRLDINSDLNYRVETTSGQNNNCLVYSILGDNYSVDRKQMFSVKRVRDRLGLLSKAFGRAQLLEIISTNYKLELKSRTNDLRNSEELDELASMLSKAMIESNPFLDVSIALPIILKQAGLCRAIVVTPCSSSDGVALCRLISADYGNILDLTAESVAVEVSRGVTVIYHDGKDHFSRMVSG